MLYFKILCFNIILGQKMRNKNSILETQIFLTKPFSLLENIFCRYRVGYFGNTLLLINCYKCVPWIGAKKEYILWAQSSDFCEILNSLSWLKKCPCITKDPFQMFNYEFKTGSRGKFIPTPVPNFGIVLCVNIQLDIIAFRVNMGQYVKI